MHAAPRPDSSTDRLAGGSTTRAHDGADDTAQPSLTSGFGAVMEQEQDIQSTTAGYLGSNGRSDDLDRVLRHHTSRLGANIALLEQRYETLPCPARFRAARPPGPRHSRTRHVHEAAEPADVLPRLVAQHRDIVRNIQILITQRPDGQRGELILSEIVRNHEEMAAALTALLRAPDPIGDSIRPPVTAIALPATEAVWENEGGPTPPDALR